MASNLSGMKDELADVLIYALMLCSDLELDLETIIKAKLEKNNQKYPIDKAKGSKEKYSDLS